MTDLFTPEEAKIKHEQFKIKCLAAACEHLRNYINRRLEKGHNSISSAVFAYKSDIWDYQWDIQREAVILIIKEMKEKGWYIIESKADSDTLFKWSKEAPKSQVKKKWWKLL